MHSFFGTDGIRTKVGTSPLTPQELVRLGYALGMWAQKNYPSCSILIGHDTRHSASFIKSALKTGLLYHSVTIHDGTIMTTPELYYYVTKEQAYDIGIMITASHNQYYDNGIKIISKKSGKLSAHDEAIIMQLYHEQKPHFDSEHLGTEISQPLTTHSYTDALLYMVSSDFLEGITIVLDCAHGATSKLTPSLFKTLGAHVITINNNPNGKNINNNVGSLYPNILQKAVLEHNAHIGFAYDGDGDRITVVSHEGIIKDGDDCTALLLNHPCYAQEANIIGTIMTNQGLEHHIQLQNKTLIRTNVGDKYVMESMHKHNALIGSEPSGHIILHDFSGTSDALFTSLRLLETIILTGNWNLDSFKKFEQYNATIPVTIKRDLSCEPFVSIIQEQKNRDPQGRIIVRYSGTEPLLRIMVENKDKYVAQEIYTALSQQLMQLLT